MRAAHLYLLEHPRLETETDQVRSDEVCSILGAFRTEWGFHSALDGNMGRLNIFLAQTNISGPHRCEVPTLTDSQTA